ncbi:restriction endonuclease subunit S [Pseudomonas sp. GD03909]|nr:restriction endonuclease subunit S [Pseudomonas sp. GD03909]
MSFSAYPIYKSSGDEWLSEVPEHWEVLPLKHFAEVDNSGCYGVEPADGDHIRPVATTAQIDSEGRFDVGRMSDRGFSAQELARYECSPGDVLVVKSSGSAENIISGKAGLVREDTPAFVFSNFLMRLRHRKDVCLPSFLYSLLISHLTRERIKQMCSTTTYPNLQVGLYTSAKLPCPPLSEQTQIARFLDHETARIDALIEEQQRLIELLKEKRQAVISHAVTKGLDPTVPMKDSGVEWLGEVPAHWEVTKLGWILNELTYGFTNPMPTEDDGPAMLTANDIGWGTVLYEQARSTSEIAFREMLTDKSRPKAGDLLLTKDGTLGRVAVHDGRPACINQSVALIRPDTRIMSSEFLCSLLQASCYQTKMIFDAGGTTIKHIYITILAKMNLAVPSLDEQQALLNFISSETCKFDRLTSEAEQVVNLLQERRSALISAAVTGKIDVRGWQPPASTQAPKLEVAEAD